MRALAHAKVNLGLRVGAVRDDGFHPIRSLFQSISWSDRLELLTADEDVVAGWDGGDVPHGEANLAWRAVVALREAAGAYVGLRLRLQKRIPTAAGLGGGSADAAAALQVARMLLRADAELPARLAPDLGSDVPFCLVGGTAVVRGRGEIVSSLEAAGGFGLALVVPPIELATPQVFATWDRIGEPKGAEVGPASLPPSLREHAPLVNDLYPAAVRLAPEVDDWRSELEAGWGRPVLMSGSGPTLYGFFVDPEEAGAALDAIRTGARATSSVKPVARGWEIESD